VIVCLSAHKRGDVPINLYAMGTQGMFGVEELRHLLERQVRFRSLMVKDSDASADGADLVAEFMRMERLYCLLAHTHIN
jgi:hypothetical protein